MSYGGERLFCFGIAAFGGAGDLPRFVRIHSAEPGPSDNPIPCGKFGRVNLLSRFAQTITEEAAVRYDFKKVSHHRAQSQQEQKKATGIPRTVCASFFMSRY